VLVDDGGDDASLARELRRLVGAPKSVGGLFHVDEGEPQPLD
jgi:hypothetical protein